MSGRISLVLACLVACSISGCGVIIDTSYLKSSRQYTEEVEQSRATEQTVARLEYEGEVDETGAVRLRCFERTRRVQRTFHVQKRYERRGGYSQGAYTGAMVGDAILGGITAAILAGACTREDTTFSCANLVWLAPWALDVGYSLLRRQTVRPAVLVDKRRDQGRPTFAAAPEDERETACESVQSVWFGVVSGFSDEAALVEGESRPRTLNEGGLAIELDEERRLLLSPEVVDAWVRQPSWYGIHALDGESVPHELNIDKCEALLSHRGAMSAVTRGSFENYCGLTTKTTP